MNPLKFIKDNQFYYGDTDSAILEKPLNSSKIGNEIGQFKLEYPTIRKAYFIGPKLYMLELEDGSLVCKCRGHSGNLTYLDYLELYNGGIINTINERWRNDLNVGNVTITQQALAISSKFTKRNRIYSLGK